MYREAGERFGHAPEQLQVGMHSLGYVATSKQQAADDFYPGFAKAIGSVSKERGWGPMTRSRFDAQLDAEGALLIGDPEDVIEKILHHSEALGGLTRVTFQMNASSLPHAKLMKAIEMLGTRVAPAVRRELAASEQVTANR
jgi:alkanesulfonate monooxygenase SsuD/methylene tetrahydromethanopterin reductase-like flavin-dependent oxidoreductase (luciferase family)